MQRLTKHYSLYEMEPELIKEWHPTANGNLTPRKVNITYPKPVWWICSQSHEWEATIKSRIKGIGCPVCKKDWTKNRSPAEKGNPLRSRTADNGKFASKESKIVFESVFSDTHSGQDSRKSGRFKSISESNDMLFQNTIAHKVLNFFILSFFTVEDWI